MLDQSNLGGIGGSLAVQTISQQPLRTAPAVYSMAGSTYVALQGPGVSCPAPSSDHQLTVLKIGVGDRPTSYRRILVMEEIRRQRLELAI